MNIAFLITDITWRAGTERATCSLANTLAKNGHTVSIISLFKAKEGVGFELEESINIYYLTGRSYVVDNQFKRLIAVLNAIFSSRKLKKYDFKYIIGQNFLPNLVLWLSGNAKKTIAYEHFKYALYSSLVLNFRDYIYRRFLQVIVLNSKHYESFENKMHNVTVIPNVLPFGISEKNADIKSKKIISVGRLGYEKGYDLLLASVKDIFIDYPDWSLNIYGEGCLEDELIKQRDNLLLQNHVFFRGYVSDIREKYLESSIYVLSSRFEGLPLVLLEAMSCGLPVIAFDCPEGPSSILADNAGILVEAENTDKLKDAISLLISDESLRKQYALRGKKSVEKYLPDEVVKKWNDLFEKLG